MATKKKESELSEKIVHHLNSYERSYCVITHGGMYVRNLPDIVGSMAGLGVFVEVKNPGKHPTEIQAYVLRKFAESGALSVCVHSIEELLRAMNGEKICGHCRELLPDSDFQLGRVNCDRCRATLEGI